MTSFMLKSPVPLAVIVEDNYQFLMPLKHFNMWESNHPLNIKVAASVVVIGRGEVIKNNLLDWLKRKYGM